MRDASVKSEIVDAARSRFMGWAFRGGLVATAQMLYSQSFLPADSRSRHAQRKIPFMASATKAKKKTVRIASGLKRARQDVKLRAANMALRSRFRTVIKNVQKAVDAGEKDKAAELFKAAQPVIDSVADKKLFHKNKAARHKSRLAAKVKALATA